MLAAMAVFALGFVVSLIATEVLRSIIDARRVRQRGIGGTQDVALWGMAAYTTCLIGYFISLVLWLSSR